jgi:pyruvate dehydrogenase E1 component alpha subunit
MVFVCENNMYAVTTPTSYHCAAGEICARAMAYNIPGVAIDGTDVLAVYETAREAVNRARRGEGPSLIEVRAFRYYGHFMGEPQTYKTKEEMEGYKARDPIKTFKNRLLERHLASESELTKIDIWAEKAVEEAVRFAEESPLPAPEECLTDVYVSYPMKEVEL